MISRHALILLKGVDEVKKRLRGKIVARDGLGQGDEHGGFGVAGETVEGLRAEIGEEAKGFVPIAGFVAEIVGDTAKSVDVAEILAKFPGQQEGDDREVFVMGLGQLSGLDLRMAMSSTAAPAMWIVDALTRLAFCLFLGDLQRGNDLWSEETPAEIGRPS